MTKKTDEETRVCTSCVHHQGTWDDGTYPYCDNKNSSHYCHLIWGEHPACERHSTNYAERMTDANQA